MIERNCLHSIELAKRDYKVVVVEPSHRLMECEALGLKVVNAKYVQLGHWDISLEATDKRAKEILFVLEKIRIQ